MIADLERDATLPAFAAEVCIVGAGAAGIVLAAELVRQGRRVLLLESGGNAIEPAAQQLNACMYTGQPHQGANIGRFRALGGTTTMWGGQILELGEEDFAARAWVPGSGWPFPKDELRPYYERALHAEGLSQVARSDREVWRQMKMIAPEMGDALEPYCTRWCPEPNFARLYREIFAAPNLFVVLHATVTTMTAARYVFCQGSIESVRFLLQPLPGAQTPPWNSSGLLGHHFQSHIDHNAARIKAEDAIGLRRWFANAYLRGYKYHPKFRLALAVQRREQILNIAGSITCISPVEKELRRVKSMARNLVQGRNSGFTFADLPRALRQLPAMLQLAYGYGVQQRAYWPQGSNYWLRVHCEQEPLSQSRITLTDTRDVTGLLQVQLDWQISPLEWRTIRRFTAEVQRTFTSHGWARIEVQPELADEDGFRNIVFDNSHHHMGGARIAASAADGVVDPNLRLHGIDNAHVCSASVFPSSGFSNPTHTLIALAIRLADHLASRPQAASESIARA